MSEKEEKKEQTNQEEEKLKQGSVIDLVDKRLEHVKELQEAEGRRVQANKDITSAKKQMDVIDKLLRHKREQGEGN